MNFCVSRIAILDQFLKTVETDPRISPAHISLYLSILQCYQVPGYLQVEVHRDIIAGHAKISASTYHRCINQLHEYGYIQYVPSFDPKKASTVNISVILKNVENDKERRCNNHESDCSLFQAVSEAGRGINIL